MNRPHRDRPKKNETPLSVAFKQGAAAARENALPGALLWLAGIIMIVCYYQIPIVREALESLGQLKTNSGWVFGIVSTSIFGGPLPLLLPIVLAGLLLSNLLFWGFKGLEIDLLYFAQAWVFGTGNDLGTIPIKVAVDGAIYQFIGLRPLDRFQTDIPQGNGGRFDIRLGAFATYCETRKVSSNGTPNDLAMRNANSSDG